MEFKQGPPSGLTARIARPAQRPCPPVVPALRLSQELVEPTLSAFHHLPLPLSLLDTLRSASASPKGIACGIHLGVPQSQAQ